MAQAQSIQDRPEYPPSSDIYFDTATGQLLGSVYPVPPVSDQEFHVNVLYQDPYSAESIDAYNDRAGASLLTNTERHGERGTARKNRHVQKNC